MDPFVVATFGRSTFRTKALRHTLNPTWNEKLYFHVNEDDINYKLKFSVYDKDKVSGNDFVAANEISILDIINKSLESGKLALKPASTVGTGNKCNDDEEHIRLILGNSSASTAAKSIESEMDMHTIDLNMANQSKWEGRHQPTLTFRAKYVPYEEIRKMFWLTLTKTYDADNNGRMSHMEVQTMLESLGSTISDSTIDEFWSHFNKTEDQELEFDELIDRLEAHIVYSDRRRQEAKKAREPADGIERSDTSNSLFLDPVKFYQYDSEMSSDNLNDSDSEDTLNDKDRTSFASSDHDEPLAEAHGVQYGVHDDHEKPYDINNDKEVKLNEEDVMESESENIEKIIHVKECPICHRPNLNRKSQMDIITHIATCAADDWTTVDKFVMGNFITEAYAQRK
jgi:phosphatidylserine decarboxylase